MAILPFWRRWDVSNSGPVYSRSGNGLIKSEKLENAATRHFHAQVGMKYLSWLSFLLLAVSVFYADASLRPPSLTPRLAPHSAATASKGTASIVPMASNITSTTLSAPSTQWYRKFFDVAPAEMPKFFSLSFMMFWIVFIFTMTRDTKDTLIVTNCGAEAIAFLKVYGVLPAAALFMMLYAKMANHLHPQVISSLLSYYRFLILCRHSFTRHYLPLLPFMLSLALFCTRFAMCFTPFLCLQCSRDPPASLSSRIYSTTGHFHCIILYLICGARQAFLCCSGVVPMMWLALLRPSASTLCCHFWATSRLYSLDS